MKRVLLGIWLLTVCLATSQAWPAMGWGPLPEVEQGHLTDEPAFLANGDFEGGLTGYRDSGYGTAVPWVPYVSTRRDVKAAQYEVIRRPLGAIYSGQLAQRWWGEGIWRGGVYQSFALPPGLYSFEVWYADPASAGLDDGKRTNIRIGVNDGISGYVPPVMVRWSPMTGKVEPRWKRLNMYGVPLTGRAATIYIETWTEDAVYHNVVIDRVEVRVLSFFGDPQGVEPPRGGHRGEDTPMDMR